MTSQEKAVKDHNAWHVKKQFFEEMLTEYRNQHNGEKDCCMVIFFDKRGNFSYNANDEQGKGLTPIESAGLLDLVKSSIFYDNYAS
jgi:hypothetical protein